MTRQRHPAALRTTDPDVVDLGARWQVRVSAGGRRHDLGIYDDPRTAVEVARRARNRLGAIRSPEDLIPWVPLERATFRKMLRYVSAARRRTP